VLVSNDSGPFHLAAAAHLVNTRPLLLPIYLIAGDGPQTTQLQQLAHQLDLDGTVRFLGVRKDISVLNRLLDVFVLPSREEACPMALLEAMAAGKAAVATAVGGTPEVVTHEVDGWLVPPDDPEALSQALLMLLEDSSHFVSLLEIDTY
jgi:glycosyltransferase involved in cell wall biosynthesis